MKYSLEADLIWENYMSPKEGGLPFKADPAQGMPYGGSPSADENCEDNGESHEYTGEAKEIHMAMSDLQALAKQSMQLLQQLKNASTIPGWVQAKITVANHNITDVAQYMDFESKEDCGCDGQMPAQVKAMRIVAI
jgi:hypothetical protein